MENKLNLTPEQLEQAKTANSADALLSLAQENGIAMTNEQAAEYYAELHAQVGVLSDEEMDNVSGGWGSVGEKGFSEFVTEILNKYCRSCQYNVPSRKPTVECAMSQYSFVCHRCPNIATFNYKAKCLGFERFSRSAN